VPLQWRHEKSTMSGRCLAEIVATALTRLPQSIIAAVGDLLLANVVETVLPPKVDCPPTPAVRPCQDAARSGHPAITQK
jgi:hypothetical protein